MHRTTLLLALFIATSLARADGVPVAPDTPSTPPPAPTSRPGKAPPDCVNKALEAIFDKEKAYIATAKNYSESLLEIHALSAIGLGCPGWELPEVKITYGGTGFNAVMAETSSGDKWTLNQDKALILEEKEVKPIEAEEPAKKKAGLIVLPGPAKRQY